MRAMRGIKLAALTACTALALAACGSSGTGGGSSSGGGGASSSGGGGAAPTKTVKVGLAYDVGGRGDKSFNDLAAAGL